MIAAERSSRFLEHARSLCAERGLSNVRFQEMDVAADTFKDNLGPLAADAAWCRWVACFVSSPARLAANIAAALRPGGVIAFHEYIDYESWLLTPRGERHAEFVKEVMASWRDNGGEPNVARQLPRLLVANGFAIRSLTPCLWALRPSDPEWQWPATFIESNLRRLLELGRVEAGWTESVRAELRAAEADPASVMTTPLVLEIIAERTPS